MYTTIKMQLFMFFFLGGNGNLSTKRLFSTNSTYQSRKLFPRKPWVKKGYTSIVLVSPGGGGKVRNTANIYVLRIYIFIYTYP